MPGFASILTHPSATLKDCPGWPLEAPVLLHQPRPVASHSEQEGLRRDCADGSAAADAVVDLHAKLYVDDAGSEERSQRRVEELAVGAVELGDGGSDERERHPLGEIGVRAPREVQRVLPSLVGALETGADVSAEGV